MDCSAIVLNKLLTERNLDIWSKLKLAFLDPAFSSLYSAISKYYDNYNAIPSFDELELTLREGPALRTLATLKLAENPDISAEVAVNALIDQYTQNEAIKLLDKFIDKLPVYDSQEIKDNLSNIVLALEDKTLSTEGVYNMADILLFKNPDEIARDRVHLGFNNSFDAALSGVARQELILIGGKRGSGKSICSSNILVNQYESGNTSVIFTIEMTAKEVLERNLSILANVNQQSIKQNR
jgi:replicative DNA helicase